MQISGWGRYPVTDANIIQPQTQTQLAEHMRQRDAQDCIARGLGRSYGDSSLAAEVLSSDSLQHFLNFDENNGDLTGAAGVSLAEILEVFVPRGWFLPVTPGTKFVTLGGAIASDVHGKNHHVDGCFAEHVSRFSLLQADGTICQCSRQENPDLFFATCGGMGLTGMILDATLRMKPIQSSFINQTLLKATNLEDALEKFETHADFTYSVAWIDCLATGKKLGRSLLMLGEHAKEGDLHHGKQGKLGIPIEMPAFLLNRYSIQAFNFLYYNRVRQSRSQQYIHYDPFFYPLDGIYDWNRLYGKPGFTQYQFVLPKAAGLEGVSTVLQRIAQSKKGSFLAVLKAFGKGNDHWLSFPFEGYTLALDFKLEKNLFTLLNELDQIVLDYEGRLYLSKDARMSEAMFKQTYPNWQRFQALRQQTGADKVFNSLQSRRLGL